MGSTFNSDRAAESLLVVALFRHEGSRKSPQNRAIKITVAFLFIIFSPDSEQEPKLPLKANRSNSIR